MFRSSLGDGSVRPFDSRRVPRPSSPRGLLALLALAAILILVLGLRSQGVSERIGRLWEQVSDPAASLDPQTENEELQRATRLPTAERIDALLGLVLLGSERASSAVEQWRPRFAPGSLTPLQRQRLEEAARRSFDPRVRRCAAGLLLADGGRSKPPAELEGWSALPPEQRAEAVQGLGLWALRGEQPPDTRAFLQRQTDPPLPLELRRASWRALAALGEPGLDLLLDGLASPATGETCSALAEALLDLASAHGESRARMVPRVIALLEQPTLDEENRRAALHFLEEVSGKQLGADPQEWAGWWQRTQELQQRFAGE